MAQPSGQRGKPLATRVGNTIRKLVPTPTLLLTVIRPPCRSTMRLTIASPSPAPPEAGSRNWLRVSVGWRADGGRRGGCGIAGGRRGETVAGGRGAAAFGGGGTHPDPWPTFTPPRRHRTIGTGSLQQRVPPATARQPCDPA